MDENHGAILLCKSSENKYNRSRYKSNNQGKQASHEYICQKLNAATYKNAHEKIQHSYIWYTATGNVQ